ncbi:MAG: hypothetical protein MZV64_16450 [Ignavibacteriales bacterium]|nr:hypothetical protein [Ignavibacteriales bacterium]
MNAIFHALVSNEARDDISMESGGLLQCLQSVGDFLEDMLLLPVKLAIMPIAENKSISSSKG